MFSEDMAQQLKAMLMLADQLSARLAQESTPCIV